MSALLSPDTFDFVARYFLAGFIMLTIRARYVAGLRPKPTEAVAEAVIFSLVNQLVFLAGVSALTLGWDLAPSGTRDIWFFSEVVILPVILGILIGLNLERGWDNAALRLLSAPVSQPTHRAYDLAFARHETEAVSVIISFEDGTVIAGLLGEDSMVSTDEEHSDIFLEALYEQDDTGEWKPSAPPRSALIWLENVRSIEFIALEG